MATVLFGSAGQVFAQKNVAPSPNGIEMPAGYKDWRLIGSSHRTDNNTLRVILGNDIAIKAARSGNIKPWPDGSILAKLVWKDDTMPNWKAATSPGDFVLSDFMIKDAKKYSSTNGWGFARWKGLALTPYGKDESFAAECSGCHAIEIKNDSVFTRPSPLP